jgi:hypothetical protein
MILGAADFRVEDFPAVIGYHHHVIHAVPPHMGQIRLLVRKLPLLPERASRKGSLSRMTR